MKTITSLGLLMIGLSAGPTMAAPVIAESMLHLSHGWSLNGGDVPDGLDFTSSGLTTNSDASSSVDDPTAIHSESSFAQVGNSYATPPLPFLSRRRDATQLPGMFDGAAADTDISVLMVSDPDHQMFHHSIRDVVQQGSAAILFGSDPVAATASSSRSVSRDFAFQNTTNGVLSFNIAGSFDASLSSSFTGDDGLVRTSGGFDMVFSDLDGAQITYFPVSPYLTSTTESDAGASVMQSMFANSDGITGISFDASAIVIGSGGTTEASFEGQHRYVFGISLDPGATLSMFSGFQQANFARYAPQPIVPPVPLPASLPLLLLGLGGLIGLRRR